MHDPQRTATAGDDEACHCDNDEAIHSTTAAITLVQQLALDGRLSREQAGDVLLLLDLPCYALPGQLPGLIIAPTRQRLWACRAAALIHVGRRAACPAAHLLGSTLNRLAHTCVDHETNCMVADRLAATAVAQVLGVTHRVVEILEYAGVDITLDELRLLATAGPSPVVLDFALRLVDASRSRVSPAARKPLERWPVSNDPDDVPDDDVDDHADRPTTRKPVPNRRPSFLEVFFNGLVALAREGL